MSCPAFYASKNHDRLHGRPLPVEAITRRCMVSPHHRSVSADADALVACDSGAFQDRDQAERLAPDEALERQLRFEREATRDGVPRFPHGFEIVVTYDRLAAGAADPAAAVRETIAGARVYHRRRDEIRGAVAYAAQGATTEQYLGCVDELLGLARPGRDLLALGGFAGIGVRPGLRPLFADVIDAAPARCAAAGVRRLHLLGVCAHDVVELAAWACRSVGVALSTDSSSIEFNSTLGKVWHEKHMSRRTRRGHVTPWRKLHGPEGRGRDDGYHPADLTLANTARFSAWLARTGHAPPPPWPRQLTLSLG